MITTRCDRDPARTAAGALLSNQDLAAREIAEGPECNERTALKWTGRFSRHGVTGLEEVLRRVRPRVYGPEGVGAVIRAALTPPQDLGLPFASWTLPARGGGWRPRSGWAAG